MLLIMKIIFIVAIIFCFLNNSCSISENGVDNLGLEVQIEIADSLYLSVYENDEPKLNGNVKVTFINHSDTLVKLDPLNIHRLRFIEKTTGKVSNIIHQCDCFFQHPIKIAAGDTIVNQWTWWMHDGSPFVPPLPGEYLLSYGVNDYSWSKIDQEIKMKFSGNRREALELCKQKFANLQSSKYKSEEIPINLKLVQ